MVNLYSNPSIRTEDTQDDISHGHNSSKSKIPPKAAPILEQVSVNRTRISEAEILAEAQHHPADTPGAAVYEAAQALVVRELLLQRASTLGIGSDPICEDGSRQETNEDALIRQVIDQEVEVPTATAAECKRFYDNNRKRFSSGAIYEASHILLAFTASDQDHRKSRYDLARQLHSVLEKNPESFGAVAREYSACTSKDQGGNLGQLCQGSTVNEFEQALKAADAPGLLPEPVETRFGFHIIRIDRIIPERILPFKQVQQKIADHLDAACWSKAISHYIQVLSADADIAGIQISEAEGPLLQ